MMAQLGLCNNDSVCCTISLEDTATTQFLFGKTHLLLS
ncbi:hypothetical protein SAMN05421807_1043 [Virgibacillus chiguensis]|uniref:Uncharacterized protein n=1 Tax=Virgibacillus chiguensis TaxID=411959 RepID=A0A1M5Q7A3_9BACI|nr:hypothetical protein SAMN05421807_1043 [Virgibacillus chiguensis]